MQAMHRRDFIKQSAALLAVSGLPSYVGQFGDMKKRVGLIGTGLVRQVRPAAPHSGGAGRSRLALRRRQANGFGRRRPRGDASALEEAAAHLRRLPRDAQGERSRHRARRHAGSLACADDDRSGQVGRRRVLSRSRSASMSSKARPCWPRRASTSASCRSARSAAARRISSTRATTSSRKACSATLGSSKSAATTTCARRESPGRDSAAEPRLRDVDRPRADAAVQPLVHPRSWRAFMEYGNGIVGDMCVHMLDMVRWMLDLGWPKRISSTGGIFVDKKSKANISDTQTATFEFPDIGVVWKHRSYGDSPDRTIRGPRPSTATRARSRRASIPTISSRKPRARRRSTKT